MSIEAAITAAVAAAMNEVAQKIEETFVDLASPHIDGTGNYIGSISDLGGGLDHEILADPAKMGLDPSDFWHGSCYSKQGYNPAGYDKRDRMTAILGDGFCGDFFGLNTKGKNRYKFWPDIVNTVDANFDAWCRAALEAQGLEII